MKRPYNFTVTYPSGVKITLSWPTKGVAREKQYWYERTGCVVGVISKG